MLTLENNNLASNGFVNTLRNYSLRIGERLYKRLTKHIQFLKHLDSIKNKQAWLEKAILEKLKEEEELDAIEHFSPERHLSFRIAAQIDDRIERRVEIMKKIRSSFSKKQWILEAIHARLDNEEVETEIKAKELFNKIVKETSKDFNI